MCLETISKRYLKPSPKVRYGYKVFYGRRGKLHALFNWDYIWESCWLEARGPILATNGAKPDRYRAGFHAFVELRDAATYMEKRAKSWRSAPSMILLRVALRRVETEGTQCYGTFYGKVLVAREMRVPKARKEKL